MSPEAIETLVREYGYGMVLIGTYFDHYGVPLFLVFGGIAASQDLLNGYGVLACGFLGGWIADLFLYFLGFKTGLAFWMQFRFVQMFAVPLKTTQRLLNERPALMVIMGRFLFAVSKFIPPFAGMVHFPVKQYIVFSFIGNVLFSILFTGLSIWAGPFILGSLKEFKIGSVLLALAFVLMLVWLSKRLVKSTTP